MFIHRERITSGGKMKIPLIYADSPMQVTLATAGKGWQARGAAADEAQNLMGVISKNQAILKENERIAQETLYAVKLDNNLRKKFSELEESFLSRTDYENFDRDREQQINEIKSEFKPQSASNAVNISFERSFNQNASRAYDNITARKYKVLEEQGRIEIGQSVDNAATEYASASDEITKKIIAKRTELEIRRAIESNLVNPVWGENQIRSIETLFKQKEVDLADVAADQAIMANPAEARIKLKDKNYLPDLPPKVRQDKLEKAEKAYKVQKSERDSKLKEATKLAHDTEEKEIGKLYMQGKYTEGFIRVLDSKLLNGDEIKTWGKSFVDAAKAAEIPTPTEQAAEIVKINSMITRDVDANEINNYVIKTNKLLKEDKEQYLNKLSTKLNLEVDNARKSAYKIIQDSIIPKRGMLTNLSETPSETTSVMMA